MPFYHRDSCPTIMKDHALIALHPKPNVAKSAEPQSSVTSPMSHVPRPRAACIYIHKVVPQARFVLQSSIKGYAPAGKGYT